MLAKHLHFNFCLYIVAGLCLPSGTVKLKWPKLYYLYMIITDLFTLMNLITIGANLVALDVPLAKRCYSGFTALATAQSVSKLIACHIFKYKFSDYIKLWDDLVEADAEETLKEDLLKNTRAIKRLSMCVFVFMTAPMVPWGSLPLFIKTLSFIIPGLEDSYHFTAVPAKFPFYPLQSPAFEFVAIFQGVAALAVNAKLMAFDCMTYGLISYQIVQYKNLKTQFENTIKFSHFDGKIAKLRDVGMEEFGNLKSEQKTQLQVWIKKHCNSTNLCASLNQLYSPILLLQFFFNILILCSNAFVIAAATITKLELMFSVGYVIGTMIQLYMLCWIGEELTYQSVTLTQEGFWQQWYVCPPDVQTSLKIIFEKAKVPVKISAFGTFHLSIETFKSIVGTAYSYFMVLNQIKKRV